jgi:cytochrome c oxidase subunit 2
MGSVGKVALIVILAVGAVTGIIFYYLAELFIPKPGVVVSLYRTELPPMGAEKPSTTGGGITGATSATAASTTGPTLTIPAGASVQGNPAYKPDPMTAKKGDTVQVINKDTTIHTVTSGKTLEDPNKGKQFDTSMINAGATAKISTASLNPGQYPFHCDVHPYMTGTLKVQ